MTRSIAEIEADVAAASVASLSQHSPGELARIDGLRSRYRCELFAALVAERDRLGDHWCEHEDAPCPPGLRFDDSELTRLIGDGS